MGRRYPLPLVGCHTRGSSLSWCLNRGLLALGSQECPCAVVGSDSPVEGPRLHLPVSCPYLKTTREAPVSRGVREGGSWSNA